MYSVLYFREHHFYVGTQMELPHCTWFYFVRGYPNILGYPKSPLKSPDIQRLSKRSPAISRGTKRSLEHTFDITKDPQPYPDFPEEPWAMMLLDLSIYVNEPVEISGTPKRPWTSRMCIQTFPAHLEIQQAIPRHVQRPPNILRHHRQLRKFRTQTSQRFRDIFLPG